MELSNDEWLLRNGLPETCHDELGQSWNPYTSTVGLPHPVDQSLSTHFAVVALVASTSSPPLLQPFRATTTREPCFGLSRAKAMWAQNEWLLPLSYLKQLWHNVGAIQSSVAWRAFETDISTAAPFGHQARDFL